jgi:hypothetical protein
MNTSSMSLVPVQNGWAVMLADGRELARFTGTNATRQALRYVATRSPVRGRPRVEAVRKVRDERRERRSSRESSDPDEDLSSSLRRP